MVSIDSVWFKTFKTSYIEWAGGKLSYGIVGPNIMVSADDVPAEHHQYEAGSDIYGPIQNPGHAAGQLLPCRIFHSNGFPRTLATCICH